MRLPSLQAIYLTLLAAGSAMALIANGLGLSMLSDIGILIVFVAIAIFGLDMIVQRRAEIATRGSDDVDPAFHVFRGVGALAWGILFAVFGLSVAVYIYVTLTDWTAARTFFAAHDGLFVMLAGVLVTGWGLGSASRAMFRRGDVEGPARRLGDRVIAWCVIIPAGVLMLLWGIVVTTMPALAAKMAAWVKAAAYFVIESVAG